VSLGFKPNYRNLDFSSAQRAYPSISGILISIKATSKIGEFLGLSFKISGILYNVLLGEKKGKSLAVGI